MEDLILRQVRIDHNLTLEQMIDLTGRRRFVDKTLMEAVPRPKSVEVQAVLFRVDRHQFISQELWREYEQRNLDALDPYSLVQMNIDDPALAFEYKHATVWPEPDTSKLWPALAFHFWGGVVRISLSRRPHACWNNRWWFAGTLK